MVRRNNLPVIFALLIVFFAFAVGGGCMKKEQKIASFVSKGDELLAKGDPVRAALEYRNALKLDQKNVGAILGLGNSFLAEQEYQKAYSLLRSALEMDPELDEIRVEVAWLLAVGREGQMALDELARLKNPEKVQRKKDLTEGVALFSLGRSQDAIRVLTGIEKAEDDKSVQMLLAFSLKALNSSEGMENAAKKWQTLDPKDPGSFLFLAKIAMEAGDRDRAVVELQKMVDADPGDSRRSILRAKTLEELGLSEEAETAYEHLPDGLETLSAQADFWTRRGDRTRVREALEKLVSSHPEDPDPVIRLGQVLVDLGETNTAEELLDKTLKRSLKKADRERILLAKAILRAKAAKWEDAKNLCESVLAENQGSPDAHLLMGKIFLAVGKPDSAEIHLSQAATTMPDNDQVQILLAKSQFLNKKESLAIMGLKKALEANPKNVTLRMELLRYYLGRNENELVLHTLDEGLEVLPDDISLLRVSGQFESSQKHYSKAEQRFNRIIDLQSKSPLGFVEMGQLFLVQSKLDEALSWLQKGMEKENGWQEALAPLIEVYLRRGEQKTALAVLGEQSEKHPQAPAIQYLLGRTLEASGDTAGAEESFSKSIELARQWILPYHALAELFVKGGRVNEAVSKFEDVYSKSPSQAAQTELAMLYDYAGRYEDAIRVYNALIEKSAEWPDVMNNLAYLYAEHSTDPEMLAKAEDLISRLLVIQPENPFFLDTAAWVACKRGDLDLAWYNMQNSLSYAPAEKLHLVHAAVILEKRGEKKVALEYLDRASKVSTDSQLTAQIAELRRNWTTGQN
jgi:tetratricopeptide (TPR) repeat protein